MINGVVIFLPAAVRIRVFPDQIQCEGNPAKVPGYSSELSLSPFTIHSFFMTRDKDHGYADQSLALPEVPAGMAIPRRCWTGYWAG